ncbi:hypothetical protein [Asticcacaulis excentricus]|uniref:Lipoprotein n=1 Tax=Asticcacaulis excentricus TaxID=78587 RepID=A0A3G9G6P8_9CAUL|nr:hypothetical protein [Asticcacaulis excentricus]BBF80694.1 hypothetical protein EM6_1279 [Asticcacaulis excentricus]
MKKRYVVGLLMVGGFFAALYGCESPQEQREREAAEEAVWREQIATEKAKLVERMKAHPGEYNKTMDCAARRVSVATEEAHYQTFLIHRPELVSAAQRDHMINSWLDAIEGCGGDLGAFAAQMANDPDDLTMKGLTIALVRQGR